MPGIFSALQSAASYTARGIGSAAAGRYGLGAQATTIGAGLGAAKGALDRDSTMIGGAIRGGMLGGMAAGAYGFGRGAIRTAMNPGRQKAAYHTMRRLGKTMGMSPGQRAGWAMDRTSQVVFGGMMGARSKFTGMFTAGRRAGANIGRTMTTGMNEFKAMGAAAPGRASAGAATIRGVPSRQLKQNVARTTGTNAMASPGAGPRRGPGLNPAGGTYGSMAGMVDEVIGAPPTGPAVGL